MKIYRSIFLCFFVLMLLMCGWHSRNTTAGQQTPPYRSNHSLSEPAIFAEGIISTGDYESHPAFTLDGGTLYFLKSTPSFNFGTIVVSHFNNGKWHEPEIAPFSGQYSDADPFITSDGSRLYFISNRPVQSKKETDLDIWMVKRAENGWSEPEH